MLKLLACLAALLLAAGCSGPKNTQEEAAYATQPDATDGETRAAAKRPNIVFVLTDDLDYASAQKMPQIGSLLREGGTSFENAFVSHPICCPSRATALTGLYDHNHNVRGNSPPDGGFEKFLSEGHEEDSIAVGLQRSCPDSIFARSSRSLMMDSRCLPLFCTRRSWRSCLAVSGPASFT